MCDPGDCVRVTLFDGDVVEGVFDRYWGHADDDGGWVIQLDNGHEEWLETRDMIKREKLNEQSREPVGRDYHRCDYCNGTGVCRRSVGSDEGAKTLNLIMGAALVLEIVLFGWVLFYLE